MTSSETAFFTGKPEALSLYEVFRTRLLEICPQAEIRVGRTQIGFYNPRFFSAVSFLPARKAKDRPREFITVTFGLAYRNGSPRIDVATEPYPTLTTSDASMERLASPIVTSIVSLPLTLSFISS